jgi:hypothetical protein
LNLLSRNLLGQNLQGQNLARILSNDAGWTQIAREQTDMLGDDAGTVLARSDDDRVSEGLGATGFRLDDPEVAPEVLASARPQPPAGPSWSMRSLAGRVSGRDQFSCSESQLENQ